MALMQGTTKNNHQPYVKMLDDGTMVTSTSSFAVEEAQAILGNAYTFCGECKTAEASSGTLLYIKNLMDDECIHITRCYFDSWTLTPTNLLLTQGFSSSTISDGALATPKQKNSGSAKSLDDTDCTFLISDGSSNIALTGDEALHAFHMPSKDSKQRHMEGTNIIAPGGEWYIGYKTEDSTNATDGETISLSINCYVKVPD